MCNSNSINKRELTEWEKVFCKPWKCKVFRTIDENLWIVKVLVVALIVLLTMGLALVSFAVYAIVQLCEREKKSIQKEEGVFVLDSPIEEEQRIVTPEYSKTPPLSPKVVIEEKPEVTLEMIEARKLSAVTFFMMHIFDEEETFADGVDDLQNASFEELAKYFDRRRIAGSHRGFKLKFEGDDMVKKLPEFMYAPFFIEHIECTNCPNIHIDLTRLPSLKTLKLINCPEVVIDSASVSGLVELETFYVVGHPLKEVDFSPCQALERICLLKASKLRRVNVSGCTELSWCMITNAKELKEMPMGLDRSLKKLSLVDFTGCDHLRFKKEDLGRIHPAVKTLYRNGHFYIENFDMQSDPRFNQLDPEGLSQEVLES